MATKGKKITNRFLELKYGFHRIKEEESPFKVEYKMDYLCKDGLILFYNSGKHNEGIYYIGYARSSRVFSHHFLVVPFRWVRTEQEILDIYKAVLGKELLPHEYKG